MSELTHFSPSGRARMVDVSQKDSTQRVAIASGVLRLLPETLERIHAGKIGKGELPAKHPLAPHFGMLDSNRDGSLSPAEFAKRHAM